MKIFYVFYNPRSCNGRGQELARGAEAYMQGCEFRYVDVTKIPNYPKYIRTLEENANILLVGGDGTINYFVNAMRGIKYFQSIWYYPAGSGNDFWNDVVAHDKKDKNFKDVICIDKYIKCLPEVTVRGRNLLFINNVGFGLDGYCCEEGDRQRAKEGNKRINYGAIAFKGLAYAYKPTKAKVTVDGETREYRNVWLAPTMNGRFYGGGIMATPKQDRLNHEHKVSIMVVHRGKKLQLLPIFPKIFTGKHVEHKKYVEIIEGKHVTVEFESPRAVQIDGETVSGISSYEVKAYTE